MKKSLILPIILLLTKNTIAQAPVIQSVTPVSTSIEKYTKFEATIELTAAYTNPYDYDQINVQAQIVNPFGEIETIDGFYIQDYQFTDLQTGAISPLGSGKFKIRYAPTVTGTYSYTLRCTTPAGTGIFPAKQFTCNNATSVKNVGFVRGEQSHYLHVDRGSQYIPVGENMAWQENNVYLDYTQWLQKLTTQKGNFIRLWMCHWGLGLEWKAGAYGYDGLRKYQQNNAFLLDWLLDYCAEQGVFVMLCLNHHGQVSSQVNPNWYESPYNVANGGMCANTWDFFTNENAKNTLKNRLRYIVARWGYQRSIMAWELFNEVDWTDLFEDHKSEVSDWHDEMATYLKTLDVRKHLVTTSYAHDYNDPNTWNAPDLDFTQTHYYVNTPNLERVLANGNANYLNQYGKPTLNAEFGLGGQSSGLATLDPNGIHVHNSMWGGLFSGGLGSGMQWWWDSYVDNQNLYTHFAALSEVAAQIPFYSRAFEPSPVQSLGVPADLNLTPTLGWAGLADTNFSIEAGGVVTPAGAQLGQFLYGAQWNTQYRRPPVFQVNYPVAGVFSVVTGSIAGQAPEISIWLDDVEVSNQLATTGQTYSINVPAGAHTIRVDNTGTDWITISAYVFSGLGSALNVYALKSNDEKHLTGWVLHNRYNHQQIKNIGVPDPVENGVLKADNWPNGTYRILWFNCLTGALESEGTVVATNGALTIPVPTLLWDAVFYIDGMATSSKDLAQASKNFLNIYPNPAPAGGRVQAQIQTESAGLLQISLLDESGKSVQDLGGYPLSVGEQQVAFELPAELPAGMYWVRAQLGAQIAVKGLVVAGKL